MRVFRVALTGDFLDETGAVAYGDIGLDRLASQPYIHQHFVADLAPRPNDQGYWSRLYSLEITPDHIKDVDGLVVLRPWVTRSAFGSGAEDLVVIGRSVRATTRLIWPRAASTAWPSLTRGLSR